MFTTVVSSTTINCAIAKTPRIHQRLAWWGFPVASRSTDASAEVMAMVLIEAPLKKMDSSYPFQGNTKTDNLNPF